jgi:hypothetical protein
MQHWGRLGISRPHGILRRRRKIRRSMR